MAQGFKLVNFFPIEGTLELTCEKWLRFHQDQSHWLDENQDQNIIVNCQLPEMELPHHWGVLSLKFVLSGNEFYETSKGVYSVKNDRFLLLNEGTKYGSRVIGKEKIESFTIHFNPAFWKDVVRAYLLNDKDLLENPFQTLDSDFVFSEELYPLNQTTFQLSSQIRNNLQKDKEEINEALEDLLIALIYSQKNLYHKISVINAAKRSTKIEIYKRLAIAKDYLLSCYDKNITLNELGKITAMSPHHLSRHFIRFFGQTPYQFLTDVRLEEAQKLCLKSDKNVSEICHSVGFSDLSSFGKLFRKRFGRPPTRYMNSENRQPFTQTN